MPKKNIQFQPRDLAALTELGEVGLMTSDMLFDRHYPPATTDAKRVDSSRRYFRRRFQQFAKQNIVEAIALTFHSFQGPRRHPNMYRLTLDGGEILESHTGTPPARPARSKTPSPITLMHRIGVVRTRLAFDDAHSRFGLPPCRWIMEQDTYPNFRSNDTHDRQFILTEYFGNTRFKMVCKPDAATLMTLPGDRPWKIAAYLEYDRATTDQADILRKVPGYLGLTNQDAKPYRSHWPEIDTTVDPPLDIVRVLFVCPSPDRRQKLASWIAGRPAQGYYRFAVEDDIQPDKILTEPIWMDVRGDFRAILPSPPTPS